jgi:hypothetical protein
MTQGTLLPADRRTDRPVLSSVTFQVPACTCENKQVNVIRNIWFVLYSQYEHTRSLRTTYSDVIWWWHMQSLSCFCISSGPGTDSILSLESCPGVIHPSPISERFAVSFSSWLHATHTSVAYKPWKLANTLVTSTNAVNCHKPIKMECNISSVLKWI